MQQITEKHVSLALEADPEVDATTQKKVLSLLTGKSIRRTLLNTAEACKLAGDCHPITLRRLEKRGHLHPIRYSARKIRWDRDEILDFVNHGIEGGGGAMIEKKDPALAGAESHPQTQEDGNTFDAVLQEFDKVVVEKDSSTEVKAFYDHQRKEYVIPTDSGWIAQTESQFKRRLRKAGFSAKVPKGSDISPVDAELLRIQDHFSVSFAGPLAGYQEGVCNQNDNRILVTKSPKLPAPREGSFDTLKSTIRAILFDPDHLKQLDIFFGWILVAVKALRSGSLMPGQAMAMAGPAGCGKSLVQNLVTVILGGRSAKPYQFMTGTTAFNSELFAAEHLMIEDETPLTDYKSRRKLGSFIKQLTVNQDQRFHAKGRDALMLKPFWRVTISLNDEPEDLCVLPPLDAGLEDKLIILRAFRRQLPMPLTTHGEKKVFWDTLCSEIPAFLHWLLNSYRIPDDLQSDRFCITHFHNPKLINALHATSNEGELLALVDSYITLPFNGTAAKLDSELRRWAGHQADKLLSFNGAAATYLGRLAQQPNPRVFKHRTAKHNAWRIISEPVPPPPPNNSTASGGCGTL